MYSPNKRISIASVSVGLDPQALHQRECPVAVDPPRPRRVRERNGRGGVLSKHLHEQKQRVVSATNLVAKQFQVERQFKID